MKKQYTIAVLGCGAIFSRHLSAISENPEYYKLIGIYDIDSTLTEKYAKRLSVKEYKTEQEVYKDEGVNCIVILTPSSLHFKQVLHAIEHKKNVIVEKPATFLAEELAILQQAAKINKVDIFTILQVRLNRSVMIVKDFIHAGYMGQIRGFNLIQRWQRPASYFSGWRGSMATGGGILREFSIHYLDVLLQLLGQPKVAAACGYNNKFTHCDVKDTIYTLLDFGKFGGSCELSIAAEPHNIECSLSIMSDQGFIKLGGKSLDEIINVDFLEFDVLQKFNAIKDKIEKQEVATLATSGASPYHPELYRQIILHPQRFAVQETHDVIKLIEEIYNLV